MGLIRMPKHCPICNRSSDDFKFYGEFCEVCTREKVSKDIPNTVRVEKCKVCKKIRLGNSFVEPSMPSIEEELRHELPQFEISLKDYNIDTSIADVELATYIHNERLVLEKKISIKYIKTICRQCMRRLGGYFEAVFQLRGDPEKIKIFKESVKNFFESNNEFVVKEEDASGGMNIYLSNKKLAASYLNMFKVHFVRSFTLHTVKNGKKIYRNTYSIHL
ncbi:MAG: NMD3-related protein [Candidatus Micrarchaeia archaeon]